MASTPSNGRDAIALFAGCGGFSEGMRMAGFRVRHAVEKDKYACATYRFNFPSTELFEGEVATFAAEAEGGPPASLKGVNVVFGGPPCQGYSQIGTRNLADPRNRLYRDFIKVLEVFRPAVFVMENVPNMAMLQNGMFRDAALAEFSEAGYGRVDCIRLVASDFGVPQERRRLFYFGVRDGLRFKHDIGAFAREVAHGFRVGVAPTVSDAISDLPQGVVDSGSSLPYPKPRALTRYQREMRLDSDGEIYRASDKLVSGISHFPAVALHNHHTKEIQARRLKLIRRLQPGMKADSLPKSMWDGLRPEKWRRLHPDRVAHTLLAQMHRDLSEFVHPTLDRWITVREALRLQAFHDGFVPVTSEWQQLKQVGNAVPPLLARTVGLVAQEILAEIEKPRASRTFSGVARSQLPLVREAS